ncbi:SHIPPO_1-like protein [Hexamita inflata]|uniref:SHIPPO 1-like protein n=1 Tax=Hexamita inflata TaxID=28002 RepID=A0AA86P2I8_9EUKA|nr:SHIPPO 1-like protein [Hexamita inflata]
MKSLPKLNSTKIKHYQEGPGPGSYSPTLKSNTTAFSIRARTKIIERDPNPGAGDYNIPTRGPHQRSMPSITSIMKQSTGKQSTEVNLPGPGSYSPQLLHSQQGASLHFRTTVKNLDEIHISPQKYEIEVPKDPVAFSLKGRQKEINHNVSPGPDAYMPVYRAQSPTTVRSIVIKPKLVKDEDIKPKLSPGPGDYEITIDKGQEYSGAVLGVRYNSNVGTY